MAESRTTLDIAPRAIVKVLATIVLVWVWLQLWQLVTLIVVAVVLAVAVEPIVAWLERRRIPRSLAAIAVVLVPAILILAFFLLTGSSLIGQAHLLGNRLQELERWTLNHWPPFLAQLFRSNPTVAADSSVIASY